MFLVRDFSKENLKKDTQCYQTLRACTSEKRLAVFPPPNEYLRVGSYKYRQQDLLGKGFSSKVYKATHISNSEERYAIKVINLKKFKASNITMLQSQIEVHRTLNHPNVVQFFDAYKTQNYYYIVTQYCPHGDLMQSINQKKKIQESKAQNIIQQIIQGYVYLSKKFILHRDLKPANIFRNGDIWKIGDFGFSMVCRGESFFDKINVGTPLYMPPQSLKTNKYSSKSDIFAIGIILFEMITGRTPWQCKTQKQLLNKMKTQTIKVPQTKSQQLKTLIIRACQVNEAQRLSINDLTSILHPALPNTNPQQKQNERKILKNALSMKNMRESIKSPGSQIQKNTELISLSSKETNVPSTHFQSSTEVSQKSDSNRLKLKQNANERNTRLLLQQLQFCRLIYYMTKNMKYFPMLEQKTKSFMTLTLFKHLLRCIKQLEDPVQNFSHQLINFQTYQNDKQYKKLYEQIKSYSKRYEKQYLDVLKNTQISIIRSVNKKFPELSYNSGLGETFYRNYYQYFFDNLRLLNHGILQTQGKQNDKQLISASYQSLNSVYIYLQVIQEKLNCSLVRKTENLSNFTEKIVMDFRHSKLQRNDYEILRQKIKQM